MLYRQDLKEIKPYTSNAIDPKDIRLDANESPFGLPSQILDQFLDWLQKKPGLNRYPDNEATVLRNQISKHYNCNEDNLIIGVGSDSLIDSALRCWLEEGDTVLFPEPSFSMYRLSTIINHGIPETFPFDKSFQYKLEVIRQRISEVKPKVLILCSPNNPTGSTLSIDMIENILESFHGLVIVDEAYGEFTVGTAADLIDRYHNVLVLRTFSKALGLAGIRLGYGIGNQSLIEILNKTRPPYNINALTLQLGSIALENYRLIEPHIKDIKKETKWLSNQLSKRPFIKIFPTEANFIFAISKKKDLGERLKKQGILIRSLSKEKGYYRISCGSREENNRLLHELDVIEKEG